MPNQVPALRNVYQIALQQPTIAGQYYQSVLNNIATAMEEELAKFYKNNMNTTIEINLMPAFGGFMLPNEKVSVVFTYDYINQDILLCYVPFMADFENMDGEYETEIKEYKITDPEVLEYEGLQTWASKDFITTVIKKLYEHNLIGPDGDIPNKYKPLQINNEIGLS